MVAPTFNPRTKEAESGVSLLVQVSSFKIARATQTNTVGEGGGGKRRKRK